MLTAPSLTEFMERLDNAERWTSVVLVGPFQLRIIAILWAPYALKEKAVKAGEILRFLRHTRGEVYLSWQSTAGCHMRSDTRGHPRREGGAGSCAKAGKDEPERPREGGRASGTEGHRWKTNPATTAATRVSHRQNRRWAQIRLASALISFGSFFNYVHPD